MSMSRCPICFDPSQCKGYPLMWDRLRAGRDVAHWTKIHAELNGIAPSYPPLLEQLGNTARAAVGFAASGFKVADQAEQERRIAICYKCEKFDSVQQRCTVCGCKGTWKAWVASSQCPIGKW